MIHFSNPATTTLYKSMSSPPHELFTGRLVNFWQLSETGEMKIFILLFFSVIQLAEAYQIKMIFDADEANSQADQMRLERISERVSVIAKSEEFKQKALNFTNYSCMQAYNFPVGISSIDESLAFIDTASVEIKIKFFEANNSVVAVTGTNSISFNRKMFDRNSDAQVANTLFHESLHALGFRHCNRNNIRLFPKIKRSLPYKFGDFVQALW